MLTAEEFAQAQATLSTADTEKAALDQQRRDCIAKARELNDQTRACTNKSTAIDQATAPIRAAVAEYIGEQKRQQAEKVKADAEARAKAAAEAKAQEQSELAKATAEIVALKEQLAAKG